jgi:hypothetical protein
LTLMNTSREGSPGGLRGRLSRRAGRAALVALAFTSALFGLFALGRSVSLPLPGSRVLSLVLVSIIVGSITPVMLMLGGYAEGSWAIMLNAALWFAIVFALYVLSRSRRGFLIAFAVTYVLLSLVGFIMILPSLG